jgi:ankyrin repeat protein
MFASTGPNSETVTLLLKHGAEVNATDGDEHWTPLMFAAAEGQAAVIKTLLQHDANPGLKDIDGETALDFALQRGQEQAANLLRAATPPGEAVP